MKSKSNLNFTQTTKLITGLSSLWSFSWDAYISKHHARRIVQNLLNYLPHPSHRISWALHESHDFQTWFAFYIIKNIATTRGLSCFMNIMFKILYNFKGKVLKITQLHEYHFSTNFTSLFYALAIQIWRLRKNFIKWHIIVKYSKHMEKSIKLEYWVQSNLFVVEK